ncbi:MAG: hypothetical protein HRU50_13920 [Winogradskyella sp.]|uniref:hypothetical protein n=1 Tax=Winogradskyella sp. TaxID=1883156 RepID=UPI0026007F43|nr:hypothetical protein [Winogradskyella sp.]NRB61023.1 hypothetical protein [Winogradskyella sp.]
MKTKLLTLVLVLTIVWIGNAQKTYLKITNSEIGTNVIMYPPGTKFELKTKEGYIIFKNSSDPGSIEIKEKHTLYVYPSWKDSADVFVLKDGKVEKVLTSTYGDADKDYDIKEISSNGVTAESKVTDSKTLEGKKNLEFTLSNGITFNYIDGLYSAVLGEKNLTIKHKYIVYSDLGTLKLSFNPSNGVVWWVFENYNN